MRWSWVLCGCGLWLGVVVGQARAQGIEDVPADHGLPFFVGEPAEAKPLGDKTVTPHPLLARQGSIHIDLENSGVTDLPTPLGRDPVITSRRFGDIGTCLNLVFADDGELLAFCGLAVDGSISFAVSWLDPETLDKKDSYQLLSLSIAELLALPLDLGYMVYGNDGRFWAIGRDNVVRRVGLGDRGDGERGLVVSDERDFSQYVPVERDKVASVVPTHDGVLFYMTLGKAGDDGAVQTPALVGAFDPQTGQHHQIELDGEIIENGLAVGPEAVFALTDRALYRFLWDGGCGTILTQFRHEYERATELEPGVISYGSGATPTLLGDQYVVFTDNADERIHLLVLDRRSDARLGDDPRVVCQVPLFDAGESANENTVAVHGRSMLIQNWYGAPESILGGSHRNLVPGLMRVDLREDGSGCDVVWHNRDLATPATVKLSATTGLIYSTQLDQSVQDVDAWYAIAIDFETGETKFRVRLGVGPEANIQLSPTYVGPDGALYQPVRSGLIKWQDGDTDAGSGSDSGSDAGAGAGSDAGSDSGSDSGSGTGCAVAAGDGGGLELLAAVLLLTRRRRRRRPRLGAPTAP
ncbi:MAG: hypothetical protein PVI30_21055 [Myxococcales bacterium]|jgi:MYXO-CTERM domain-containing protein